MLATCCWWTIGFVEMKWWSLCVVAVVGVLHSGVTTACVRAVELRSLFVAFDRHHHSWCCHWCELLFHELWLVAQLQACK